MLTALRYNTLWYLGSIIAAWTVFGTVKYTSDAAWRIPVGMQAAMPLIQFAFIFLLPESPRWLCSKDRLDEAFAILVKVSPAPSLTTEGLADERTKVPCQRRFDRPLREV